MVMAQLQSQHSPADHDHAQKTKSLICALNLVSRNLPLPPDLFHTVSSIYFGAEDAENNARDCDVPDVDGSEEKPVPVAPKKGLVRVLPIPFC